MKQLKYKIGEVLWLDDPTGYSTSVCKVVGYQNHTDHPYLVRPSKGSELYGAPESELSPVTKLGKLLAGVEDV
jgi:hypothetical protein